MADPKIKIVRAIGYENTDRARAIEKALHVMFRGLSVGNEWFDYDIRIMQISYFLDDEF